MSYQGGKKDAEFVKSVDYPISLERVNDVKEYLETKNIHQSWQVMFEDAKHTKRFTDIPWSVLRMIVVVYHHDKGKVSSQEILNAIRSMHFSVPLNKKGANIKSNTSYIKNDKIFINGKSHEFLIGDDGDIVEDWLRKKSSAKMVVKKLREVATARSNYGGVERPKSLRSIADFIEKNSVKQAKNGANIGSNNENAEMVLNNNKQIAHHTKELASAVKGKQVPAWVVAKVNRSASDLSDATHYLDGVNSKYGKGSTIKNDDTSEIEWRLGYQVDGVWKREYYNSESEVQKRIKLLKSGELKGVFTKIKAIEIFGDKTLYAKGSTIKGLPKITKNELYQGVLRDSLSSKKVWERNDVMESFINEIKKQNIKYANGGSVGTTFIYEIGGL
jgi:hypothetical protein